MEATLLFTLACNLVLSLVHGNTLDAVNTPTAALLPVFMKRSQEAAASFLARRVYADLRFKPD